MNDPDMGAWTHTYDAAGRPQTMSGQQYVNGTWQSLGYYVSNAHYTALGQPLDRTLGNGLTERRRYAGPRQRRSPGIVPRGQCTFSPACSSSSLSCRTVSTAWPR